MDQTTPEYHSFSNLFLTVTESSLVGVVTEHTFELRSTGDGAEVWRSSVLRANGESCESGERFVGWLTARHVINLLVEIERSGVYEALPMAGLVSGEASEEMTPLVSMKLVATDTEDVRQVFTEVPAEGDAGDLVRVIRNAIDTAQERALTRAG